MSRCRILCALAAYMLITFGAFALAQSTSGFLIPALSCIFLVDRYVFHLLNWPRWRSLPGELAWRLLCLLLGAAVFYCARFGIVPIGEALYLGLMASLTISVLESIATLLPDLCSRIFGESRFSRNSRWWFQWICLGTFALTFPYWHTLHPMHTVPKRGPDAMGFAYESLWLPTSDGTQLSAWFIPSPDARATVIYCHGHGRNKGQMAGLLTTLHEAHCNVFAFDFRGHGDSPGHTVQFGGQDVDDLCQAVRIVETRCPGKPILLVGISYGAAVALESLGRLPQIKGLWSEGAFGRLNHAVQRRLDCVPTFVLKPIVRMYYVLGKLDCNLWVPSINPVDCLAGVHVPILFCHGEQDELAPFEDALALHSRYQGPKWNYWIAGGSHYDLRQRHREEYLARFRQFLHDCLVKHAPVAN